MSDFVFSYRVAISDINYGGHMGNDRSLSLFHEARIAFLTSLGLSELNIGDNKGIIMKDAHVDFLAEIFHADELEVKVKLGEIRGLLFYLNYEVFRQWDKKIVLEGKTGILAFDYYRKKLTRTPESFFQKIQELYG